MTRPLGVTFRRSSREQRSEGELEGLGQRDVGPARQEVTTTDRKLDFTGNFPNSFGLFDADVFWSGRYLVCVPFGRYRCRYYFLPLP